MDRQQFVLLTAAALFAAFLAGWIASWLVHRLTRPSDADLDALDRATRDLQAARDAALADLARREAELHEAMTGLTESRTEIEELRDYIEKRFNRIREGQS